LCLLGLDHATGTSLLNIQDFYQKKAAGQKISMLTCYDYTLACILEQTSIDCLLVGDSAAMTMHGFKDTLSATLEMMRYHVSAVSRGAHSKFIIGDLPFLSYRKSLSKNMSAAQILMQAGAHAVKLEGMSGNREFIQHLTESGVPVMGHLGLTPQSIHSLGGYKIQGKTAQGALRLKEEAQALQEAGCFAVVLECIPRLLSKEITDLLSIPTIGIGAGPDVSGQVLVLQDLLGMNPNFQAKFVKPYLQGFQLIKEAVNHYDGEVKKSEFPIDSHSF
jgi:3-methyl-2-oxobutanoate hydroxymethyltransferase